MSGYLLDTHVLLWAMAEDPRLSPAHVHVLLGEAPRMISVASLWEIAIKTSLGKLGLREDLRVVLDETGLELLPIAPEHVEAVARLPLLHRDPFDRMLVAQAQVEGLTLLSADPNVRAYPVPSL